MHSARLAGGAGLGATQLAGVQVEDGAVTGAEEAGQSRQLRPAHRQPPRPSSAVGGASLRIL